MNIYFNLFTGELNLLDSAQVKKSDVPMELLSGNIVLVSQNDYKMFPANDFDIEGNKIVQKNKAEIQKLLRNGYKPFNEDMVDNINVNYRICPHCGEDYSDNLKSEIVVIDCGFSFANLATDNVYPYREVKCGNCGVIGKDRFSILTDKNSRKEFLRKELVKSIPAYLKCNIIIDKDKKAYIPCYIYMKHLTAFFDTKVEKDGLTDLKRSLKKYKPYEIIRILKDVELQKYFLKDECEQGVNIRFEPVRLGNYSSYTSEKDFDLIIKYAELEDNQEDLSNMILKTRI